ncbi:MAG: hypothetical protein BWY59_01269 [Verrucomicrobia bacterium ADurb.Bin345]|nr:MAG: hypothetical protein BWY59_01269 [Verrucomicrobia bacterium ADurb.Bin345]
MDLGPGLLQGDVPLRYSFRERMSLAGHSKAVFRAPPPLGIRERFQDIFEEADRHLVPAFLNLPFGKLQHVALPGRSER